MGTDWTSLVSIGLSTLHIGGATLVTIHALLRQRDSAAAVAWIGLAWLSPIFGVVLYYLLGINRVRRRARKLTPQGDAPAAPATGFEFGRDQVGNLPDEVAHFIPLGVLGERLTGRPLLTGNRFTALRNGDEAYPAMLEAIAGAEHSVALTSYIFRDDDAGRPFIDALVAARDRGAEVRVLVDGLGSGYFLRGAIGALAEAGVPAERFLHTYVPWRMPYLNMRTHKKILVIDGQTGFTGGMNIGAENVQALNPRHPVQDMHFRVDGPVVAHLMQAFAEDWAFTTGETLEGGIWFPPLEEVGHEIARGVASGPDEDFEKLQSMMAGALGRARETIRIVTPYFLPDRRMLFSLTLAAMRGVRVELVLPYPSNHWIVDWATSALHRELLAAGIRVFLVARPFDHAKLMTVDGLWALIGSANWDARSLRLNFEHNVECYGTETAPMIDRYIDDRISISQELSLAEVADRGIVRRLRDSAAKLLQPYL